MKTFFQAHGAFVIIVITLFIASCKKENTTIAQYTIPANLTMVASGYASGAATRVEIYAGSNLFVGYNKIYIALYDSASNIRLTQAQVNMSVCANLNSANVQYGGQENPVGTQAVNGLFNGAAIFTAPSSGNFAWTLSLQLQGLANQKSGAFIATPNVIQPSPAKSYSVAAQSNSASVFVCMVQPADPKLGVNNFEVAMYQQASGVQLQPDSLYHISIDAEMPDMQGMNSPNNVNPVYSGNGHYLGKINFVMSGDWQINLSLLNNTAVVDSSHYFALSL